MKAIAILSALVLAAPALAQDKAKDEAESKLKNLRVTLDFKDAPIDTVIDFLREISDLNLFLDQKVRDKNIQVSLKVSDISLKSVLQLMLKPHGCDFMWREGVVMLMTQEDVVDKTIKMELYDCRDILYPIQDFPGVDLDLSQNSLGVATIQPGDDGGDSAFPIEELVKSHTGGRSWEENQKCTCTLQNGLLIVKNTPEVHKQVVRLLNMLRRNK
jgi:type II secretory pathway component GspD/PulD (secretin)